MTLWSVLPGLIIADTAFFARKVYLMKYPGKITCQDKGTICKFLDWCFNKTPKAKWLGGTGAGGSTDGADAALLKRDSNEPYYKLDGNYVSALLKDGKRVDDEHLLFDKNGNPYLDKYNLPVPKTSDAYGDVPAILKGNEYIPALVDPKSRTFLYENGEPYLIKSLTAKNGKLAPAQRYCYGCGCGCYHSIIVPAPVDAEGKVVPALLRPNGHIYLYLDPEDRLPVPALLDKDGKRVPVLFNYEGEPYLDKNGKLVPAVFEYGKYLPAILKGDKYILARFDADSKTFSYENGDPFLIRQYSDPESKLAPALLGENGTVVPAPLDEDGKPVPTIRKPDGKIYINPRDNLPVPAPVDADRNPSSVVFDPDGHPCRDKDGKNFVLVRFENNKPIPALFNFQKQICLYSNGNYIPAPLSLGGERLNVPFDNHGEPYFDQNGNLLVLLPNENPAGKYKYEYVPAVLKNGKYVPVRFDADRQFFVHEDNTPVLIRRQSDPDSKLAPATLKELVKSIWITKINLM